MPTKEEFQKALVTFTQYLNNNEDLYDSYKSNIAVEFQGSCRVNDVNFPQLHKISNDAADGFLKNLTRITNELDTCSQTGSAEKTKTVTSFSFSRDYCPSSESYTHTINFDCNRELLLNDIIELLEFEKSLMK